jgi:uncharacterized protein YjiK
VKVAQALLTRNNLPMQAMQWIAPLVALWIGADEAWLPRYELDRDTGVALRLPAELLEISGLATDARGRLFAHQDETSAVYEIDPSAGRVLRRFHVGRVGLRGDFEGIAVVGDRFFLSNSDGDLLEFRAAADGAVAPARSISTGLGELCEIEGLAFDERSGALLLPCKTPRVRRLRERLTVFAVPLATLEAAPEPRISLAWDALKSAGVEDAGFHPSAVEVHPESGSYFLLAAQEESVLEIGRDGAVLAGRSLSRERHPQPEGIAFGPDLALWIADEGIVRGGLHRYPLSVTAAAVRAGAAASRAGTQAFAPSKAAR